MKNFSIAIDGPAGSGKSTLAKSIAKKLKCIYLDTGAMYRTVGLKALQDKIDTTNKELLEKMVKTIDIQVVYEEGIQKLILNKKDVTGLIRTNEVSIAASNVAVVPTVRLKMVDLQREIAKNQNVVMDGRDIGTYVLPNANLKIFLTASIEERAKRRYKELFEKGISNESLKEIKKDIEYRDKNDSSRKMAPLKKAEDAIELDTTELTIDEVIEKVIGLLSSMME